MYCLLVFLKCFHWITSDRVDYVSDYPSDVMMTRLLLTRVDGSDTGSWTT